MSLLVIVLVAFSISMDAFSLSLAYGTLDYPEKQKVQLSLLTGFFHFFMPILGMAVKQQLEAMFHTSLDIVTFLVFIYIGVTMIVGSKKEDERSSYMTTKAMLIFSIAVSLDSFTVGIGIPDFTLLAPLVFSIFSGIFTYLGLYLGSKLQKKIGKIATTMGGIIFIILAILYI